MVTEYDYVIAGAGSAGCALAARLAEDPSLKVCLVEAGGNGRNQFIRMPAGSGFVFGNPSLDWGFESVPRAALNGRRVYFPRDVTRAMRMADRIEAGTVYINNYFNAATQSPVGGFKQSGYGRENGFEGMRCFMQTKSVWLSTNPAQPDPFPED